MAKCSFVKTARGEYYVQVEDTELFPTFGFALASDDQTWEGGFSSTTWEIVPPEEVPANIREELQYVIDAFEEE
jgi:hypothetical protein